MKKENKEYKIIVIVSEKINENETKEIGRFAEDFDFLEEYYNKYNESILDIKSKTIVSRDINKIKL